VDLGEDSEDDSTEVADTPHERVSSAGHSLRPIAKLNLSLRALENADKPKERFRKLKRKTAKAKNVVVSDILCSQDHLRSEREELRHVIATETAAKRYKFFIAKKDYFLPLLPERNFVRKLVEKAQADSEARPSMRASGIGKANSGTVASDENISPYEVLKRQPAG
jgi:hypothetical protein